ncbi:SoxXA-binding protein [Solemya velesiana gill symbiont]|uniref:SoxXA-binding protein n=1 Tax=Solemya velesiana gill symbiont TaxID=1918948 RepID=A0A1T2KU40_9GAMM|nr:SoxXA-binding protein [Solemya velesiana gill symbiont]OOZ36369.1 SoxXA-binding protein [Solemya velesiana gill symbiont]
MRKNRFISILALVAGLAVGIVGCATASEKGMTAKQSPKAAEVAQMISDADAARKKAASVKGEWRDTGKFIKNAQKALEASELERAMKLAKKAKAEGELGYAQAVAQKDLKMPAYLKY